MGAILTYRDRAKHPCTPLESRRLLFSSKLHFIETVHVSKTERPPRRRPARGDSGGNPSCRTLSPSLPSPAAPRPEQAADRAVWPARKSAAGPFGGVAAGLAAAEAFPRGSSAGADPWGGVRHDGRGARRWHGCWGPRGARRRCAAAGV
jgi:hypothetical protein